MRLSLAAAGVILLTACGGVGFGKADASSTGTEGDLGGGNCPAGTLDCDLLPGDDDSGSGDTSSDYKMTEVNVPTTGVSVDIVFVVDNSGSMDNELKNLGSKFSKLAEALAGKDWQACLATTDWENEHGALHTWSNGSYLLRADTSNFTAVFNSSMTTVLQQGSNSSSNIEQGIRTAQKIFSSMGSSSVKGCLRNGTSKSVIFVSDEDELSNGWAPGETALYSPTVNNLPQTLLNLAAANFGVSGFTAHAIGITPNDSACLYQQRTESGQFFQAMGYYGRRYNEVVSATGGEFVSICDADYSETLKKIGSRLGSTLSALDLGCAGAAEVRSVWSGTTSLVPHSFSVQNSTVTFLPALGPGEKAKIFYRCL